MKLYLTWSGEVVQQLRAFTDLAKELGLQCSLQHPVTEGTGVSTNFPGSCMNVEGTWTHVHISKIESTFLKSTKLHHTDDIHYFSFDFWLTVKRLSLFWRHKSRGLR